MEIGVPPKSVTRLLRADGLAVTAASLVAYQMLGGNWWVFALLILAPDLSMVGFMAGSRTGATIYNLVHSYIWPIALGAAGYFARMPWLLPLALIWITHIGVDGAIGYGLKFPSSFKTTHLGTMGRASKTDAHADAR